MKSEAKFQQTYSIEIGSSSYLYELFCISVKTSGLFLFEVTHGGYTDPHVTSSLIISGYVVSNSEKLMFKSDKVQDEKNLSIYYKRKGETVTFYAKRKKNGTVENIAIRLLYMGYGLIPKFIMKESAEENIIIVP